MLTAKETEKGARSIEKCGNREGKNIFQGREIDKELDLMQAVGQGHWGLSIGHWVQQHAGHDGPQAG